MALDVAFMGPSMDRAQDRPYQEPQVRLVKPERPAPCFYDECPNISTPEGIFCWDHWHNLPGLLREQIQEDIYQAAEHIKANEQEN